MHGTPVGCPGPDGPVNVFCMFDAYVGDGAAMATPARSAVADDVPNDAPGRAAVFHFPVEA